MATVSLRGATGAPTKSYYVTNATTEWVSVVQDAQGNYSLGNVTMVGISHVDAVDYSGGGTGWECQCDNSVVLPDANGNLFWGGLPGTRKRR